MDDTTVLRFRRRPPDPSDFDSEAPTILPEGGVFGAGLTQEQFWEEADRHIGDIRWMLLKKDGEAPLEYRDDESFIDAFTAPLDPTDSHAPDGIRQGGVGHDDHPDSHPGNKEIVMLDDSIVKRGRYSAPPRKQQKESVMRNWSTIGLIAAVLTLAASPFLMQIGNDHFNGKQRLASVPTLVSEAGAAVAATKPAADLKKMEAAEVAPKRKATLYTVAKGDTLSGACGSAWHKVAGMNELVAPYTIRVGQLLVVPEGVRCKTVSRTASKPAVEQGYRTIDCSKTRKGYCEWKKPGGNKFYGKGDSVYALNRQFGLTIDEAIETIAGIEDGEEVLIATNQSMYRLSFGKNDLWQGKIFLRAAPQKAMKYMTTSGKTIYRFEVCGNWAQLSESDPNPRLVTIEVPAPATYAHVEIVSQPKPAPQPVPAIESPKEPVVAPETVTVVETEVAPAPEEETKPYIWDWDLYVGTGGDASGTKYSHAEGALYPFIREEEGGRSYFGIGGKWNRSHGETDDGFSWSGKLSAWGPAYKYADWDGWDVSVKALFGELEERGRISKYQSSRDFDIAGFSLGYNNYQREQAGEKWWPEYGLYASVFWPTSRDVKHSWDGTPIADTKDLGRFSSLVGVGYRQDIYAGEYLRPFGSVGYSAENPTSESLSLRLGVSDARKIFFASVGINHNLDDSSNVVGWDIGVDVAQGVKLARAEARRAEMLAKLEESGQVTVDEDSGIAFVATDSPAKSKTAKPVRKPAKESVWESPWDFER
jgi:hypothetical protein